MSIYFYGACHDCKQVIDASNVTLEHAENLTKMWVEKFGHTGHNIETATEFDDVFMELVKRGREIVSWYDYPIEPKETKKVCDPYQDVSGQVGKLFE